MLESIYEWRKNAPDHFWAKADNARFCAYVLYHNDETQTELLKKEASYNGSISIGLYEGYLREAAIALELALKASIASLNIMAPKTHDLGKLWLLSEAPKLDKIDTIRLRKFRMILEWAGRYATPSKEVYFLRDIEETRVPPDKSEGIVFEKHLSLGWEHFDRLYNMAIMAFSNECDKE